MDEKITTPETETDKKIDSETDKKPEKKKPAKKGSMKKIQSAAEKMYMVDGMTPNQIADTLGIKVFYVKTWQNRFGWTAKRKVLRLEQKLRALLPPDAYKTHVVPSLPHIASCMPQGDTSDLSDTPRISHDNNTLTVKQKQNPSDALSKLENNPKNGSEKERGEGFTSNGNILVYSQLEENLQKNQSENLETHCNFNVSGAKSNPDFNPDFLPDKNGNSHDYNLLPSLDKNGRRMASESSESKHISNIHHYSNDTTFRSGSLTASELGRLGGIKSGQVKKARKTAKELAEIILDSKIPDAQVKALLDEMGVDDSNKTVKSAIIAGQAVTAIKGGHKQAELVLGLVGEAPAQTLTVDHTHAVGTIQAIEDYIASRRDF